jgi:DNA replication protein DnaC
MGYRRSEVPRGPTLDDHVGVINEILRTDKALIKKQRLTAKRIFERLRDEHGYVGSRYLARLCEMELIDRERRMIERQIKAAKSPSTKSLDSFDFKIKPSLKKPLTMELARCDYVDRRENIIARRATDELGFVPLSKSGVELLFEVISQCYERGSIILLTHASMCCQVMHIPKPAL